MILGKNGRVAATAATLDDLFRRAGVRHPDALALADPPNREDFADGMPRTLSFAQADRAISALAAKLRGLGLQTDAVLAIQLSNIVESVVTFLGVLRAGMIAAPVPLLWRQQELVTALGCVGAKAIVTSSRIGKIAHGEIAMRTAAELFSIRHVCGFGRDLPDGIAPLDDVFTADETATISSRPGPAAAHVAAITFGLDASDPVPTARSHVELIAGGLEIFLETRAASGTPTLSTIPVGSFAGIAVTVLHWLLSDGALHLHHGFDPDALAAQLEKLAGGGTVVLPGAAVAPIVNAGLLADARQTIGALWRAPERLNGARAWKTPSALVDVACFGEIGLLAARRGENSLPAPIPHGAVDASRRAIGAPTVVETRRTDNGTLALRGRMVPVHAFPPGAERGRTAPLSPDPAGYVDTGFACRLDIERRGLVITTPPPGTILVGGYRFRQGDIDALVAQADADATVIAVPDSDLGQRFAGTAADRAGLGATLEARGINPLISGAFRPRGVTKAA